MKVAIYARYSSDLQREALSQVPYFPTGQYFARTASRRDITDIVEGQFVFWKVRRS